jgi:hypothetical protein
MLIPKDPFAFKTPRFSTDRALNEIAQNDDLTFPAARHQTEIPQPSPNSGGPNLLITSVPFTHGPLLFSLAIEILLT